MELSKVATEDLFRELLNRVDSIATGISRAGQEVPMDLGQLARGWGEILDLHVFACRSKSDQVRYKIGRHCVASCIKYYLDMMHSTHKFFEYKEFVDSLAEAYSNYVFPTDELSTDRERAQSVESN
jgi:hypothetical protein